VKNGTTLRVVTVLCGAIPFLLSNRYWANAALIGYSLTTVLFGILLVGEYPPLGTSWFWKSVISIVIFHFLVVFGLVSLNLEIPELDSLPRIIYGFLALVVAGEWYIALRMIEFFRQDED
jgi:hypothetical protein